MNDAMPTSGTDPNKTLTTIIYALYGASFVVGVTAIVAIILNYVKKDDVAGTIYVVPGAHVTLTWSARSVVTCTASAGWSGSKPLEGSASIGPVTTSKNYVLACRNNKGGYVTKSVRVAVGETGR